MKSDGTTVKARYDYLPLGEEIPSTVGARGSVTGYGAADSTKQKFTQKERDSESGLDYFGARYYSSPQGSFTSVDPSSKSLIATDPQSWNRYSYTLNNPLKYVDRNGKWPTAIHRQIIDQALPGLSEQQKQLLKDTSQWVDRLAGQTKAPTTSTRCDLPERMWRKRNRP